MDESEMKLGEGIKFRSKVKISEEVFLSRIQFAYAL